MLKAMQTFLGINETDYEHFLDSMVVENGNAAPKQKLLQP